MTIIAIAFLVLFLIFFFFVSSTVVGIRGKTRAHRVAFYAWALGLAAILACFFATSRVASQIPYITSGAVLFACIAILFCTSCMCVLALLSIHPSRAGAV